MKEEYDFSKMKSRKNPYASKLKESVIIRLGEDVIEYFQGMSEESDRPHSQDAQFFWGGHQSGAVKVMRWRTQASQISASK